MADPGNTSTDDLKRIATLEEKLSQLKEIQKSTRSSSRLITIALVVVVLILLFVGYNHFSNIIEKPDNLIKEANKQVDNRIVPMLKLEAEAFRQEVVPAYQKALVQVAEKRQDEMASAGMKELALLQANISENLSSQLASFQENLVEEQYQRLIKEFPELADPEKAEMITGNLASIIDGVSQKLVGKYLGAHYDSLLRLESAFNAINVPAEVTAMNNAELEQHVLDLLSEYVALRLQLSESPLLAQAGLEPSSTTMTMALDAVTSSAVTTSTATQ